jgi:hypothetical protein
MRGWSTLNSSGGGGRTTTRATPVMTVKWKSQMNAFSFYRGEERAVLLWDNTPYTVHLCAMNVPVNLRIHLYRFCAKQKCHYIFFFFLQMEMYVFSQTKLNRKGENCITCTFRNIPRFGIFICIVFILCSVSFIACVVLCAVFYLSMMCYFVWYVLFVCCVLL